MRNHWLTDVVVARGVSVATAGDINLRGRLRRINGVGNPRESGSLGREWRLSLFSKCRSLSGWHTTRKMLHSLLL